MDNDDVEGVYCTVRTAVLMRSFMLTYLRQVCLCMFAHNVCMCVFVSSSNSMPGINTVSRARVDCNTVMSVIAYRIF